MKIAQLLETSRGEQVMQFVGYLENRFPGAVARRARLEQFGNYLFKKGYVYSEGPSNCHFQRGTNEIGKVSIALPQKHWAQTPSNNTRSKVIAAYYLENGLNDRPLTSQTSIVIDDLDSMIDALEVYDERLT